MTYAAPTCDFYDDGLVHSHNWSRNTPPGGKHGKTHERTQQSATPQDHDEPHHGERRVHA